MKLIHNSIWQFWGVREMDLTDNMWHIFHVYNWRCAVRYYSNGIFLTAQKENRENYCKFLVLTKTKANSNIGYKYFVLKSIFAFLFVYNATTF